MQARFYLPQYGRFTSPDPARDQHFEQTQSWNIYSYVQNNPVTNVDPNGEETQVAIGGRTDGNVFGHAAIIINGTAYSFGTNNTGGSRTQKDWGVDAGAYLKGEVAKGRETELLTLKVTPEQEANLQKYYASNNPNAAGAPPYAAASNNCATVVSDGLTATGVTPALKPTDVPPVALAMNPAAGMPAPKPTTPGALKLNLQTSGKVEKVDKVGEAKMGFWKSLVNTIKKAL